ncbi:hypothetical protein [Paludibaculum fermentans]|uniref:hypothetical protein n=1 Tax=Paludibaculum fermentans TaxID=1473598 RepID=UPI003EBB0F44
MIRIRVSSPVLEDPGLPLNWKLQAWMLSTLFFCLPFWEFPGGELWMMWPLPQYALILALCTALMTAVFFLGPALAVQASGKSLTEAVALSVGTVPAMGIRVCCVGMLVLWIAELLGLALYLVNYGRELIDSQWGLGCLAVGVLGFLFLTAWQSPLISGRMAFLSTKLGLAILLAALFRVRDGWPAIQHGFVNQGEYWGGSVLWRGFAQLVAYLAPLALVAAAWGGRSAGRKQVVYTAALGWMLPLFVALLLIGLTNVAVGSSEFYQPSLQPNVAMALWAKSARSGVTVRVLIASVTVFGALRFCIRGLADMTAIGSRNVRMKWLMTAGSMLLITGLTLYVWTDQVDRLRTAPSHILAVTAVVLTADLLMRRWRNATECRFDWAGCLAVAAGLASPWYLPYWFVGFRYEFCPQQSILPACGVAFVACLLCRCFERILATRRPGIASPSLP